MYDVSTRIRSDHVKKLKKTKYMPVALCVRWLIHPNILAIQTSPSNQTANFEWLRKNDFLFRILRSKGIIF